MIGNSNRKLSITRQRRVCEFPSSDHSAVTSRPVAEDGNYHQRVEYPCQLVPSLITRLRVRRRLIAVVGWSDNV